MTPSDANLPARPDYVAITYINAPVERVWRAFTIPADQATFFGGKTEIGEVGEPHIVAHRLSAPLVLDFHPVHQQAMEGTVGHQLSRGI